jgi:uncharacterized protein (DUF885 family)
MKHFRNKICLSVTVAMILLVIAVICAAIIRCNNQNTMSPDAPCPNMNTTDDSVSSDTDFSVYIDALFRQEAAANLLNLHYTLELPEAYGITEYNTSPGNYSADGPMQEAAFAESVLNALQQFDTASLSVENALTLDILKDTLLLAEESASFSYYDEPLRPSTGIQSELPILLAEYSFLDQQDVCDYLEFLAQVPAYLASICQYEQEKSDAGLFMSDFAAEKIISQCEEFAASGEENYLIYTFEEKTDALDDLSENEKIDVQKQNRNIILEQVLPAFLSLADTLQELKNTGTNTAGLCNFEQGSTYYEYLVKCSTGSSDAVEILQERTQTQRLTDLAQAADLLNQYPELEDEIAAVDAPCDSPEEMISLLKTSILADYPAPPDCESTIKYVDEAMEDYLAPAFYLTSPMDHLTENSIYINQGNGYEGIRLFTTLAHEGYPGHLYQNVVFFNTDPAPIRALLGYPGYTEGWATYVELKSYRYADISEEAATLLALNQSAILSLYASADMGIHHDGWSYEDTYNFFSDYGVTDSSTVREIFELIVEEPAHYLKYYIGYLEFLSLETYAKESYGTDYSKESFHRAVLEIGPAPFSLLQSYLSDFYKNSH